MPSIFTTALMEETLILVNKKIIRMVLGKIEGKRDCGPVYMVLQTVKSVAKCCSIDTDQPA